MIDRQALLKDLKRELGELEADIGKRIKDTPELDERLRGEHAAARQAERTAQTFEAWRDEQVTQAAVAWLLGCVFVRFLEDNGLVDPPLLSGPAGRRQLALDRHELYFREHPADSDRDYLLDVFTTVAALPAAREVFDPAHNPLWSLHPTGDAARRLLGFWQRVDPDTGNLAHDFTDSAWNTRFLGDLYQDLSEAARKRYALLQTPEFVEEFILDRTLDPAIDEFGFRQIRLIDPTCGSGHFLLGAFQRLFDRWTAAEPGAIPRDLAQRALAQVFGVDLNPFAVAIARFRLLVAALQVSGVKRLEDAPAFHLDLAVGDSLLHGPRMDQLALDGEAENLARFRHAYHAEDLAALERILGQRYHAVVGNPPYITVKDKAQSQLYRDRYRTCHRQYALSVPFAERFFQLALPGEGGRPAGFVGQITSNSFMKREFGRKLVEDFLPTVDLTHVIDTSGAYIPGHGTPTVILFGREQRPVDSNVRTVMGIQGEPSTPEDPSRGLVWSAIVGQVDRPGSESEFVSVADTGRQSFAKHPWSMGGGGATELKESVEAAGAETLAAVVGSIGFFQDTHADEAFVQTNDFVLRYGLTDGFMPQVRGDEVRDFCADSAEQILFPYDRDSLEQWASFPVHHRWSWLYRLRTALAARSTFGGGTYRSEGRPWFDYHQFPKERARTPLNIAFAEIATHNHFVLDRGGKVFNRTAPVIKLPAKSSVDDHLALLGLLNSSTACFWLKQVCHNKGVGGIGGGIGDEGWEPRYVFNGTRVTAFPVCERRPLDLASHLDTLATERQSHLPDRLVAGDTLPTRESLDVARDAADHLFGRMVAWQEELDWRCYRLYEVTGEDLCYRDDAGEQREPPEVRLGERAFEIVMARQMVAGELQTTWFERHGSTPVTEVPARWPADYRALVERRIATIENERDIGLIEKPEYKRRWNQESWESQEQRALRGWLLDRLETARYWPKASLTSTARLAERAAEDADFLHIAALYRGHAEFSVPALVDELVRAEAVPAMKALRNKPAGLAKREQWERTWELQRREDAIDAEVAARLSPLEGESPAAFEQRLATAQKTAKQAELGDIPAPPKYKSSDFVDSTCWRLRGALDVPKERFVSLPGCERSADPTLVVGWAGWNALELAQALAEYLLAMKESDGWGAERLLPLLAALDELLPWVRQWHNDIDPEHGERMGDYLTAFAEEMARELSLTQAQVRDWQPPAPTRGRRGGNRRGKT